MLFNSLTYFNLIFLPANSVKSQYENQQYKIGQLYMIARHSLEQSGDGEGVEVVENKPCSDEVHGNGQYTEKRIHLSRCEVEIFVG